MHLVTLVFPLSTLALSGASLGCSVVATPEPPIAVVPAAVGTLTVTWTVAGRADSGACAAYAATDLELVVYDEAGRVVASAKSPCESFSLRLGLSEGTYTADATLINPNGTARSTTKPLQAIVIVAGTDLAIDLDFPRSSIL